MLKQADIDSASSFEFCITTQADHNVSSAKSTRISEVRSYLATRGHDYRRRCRQARKFQELLYQQDSDNDISRTCSQAKRPLRPKGVCLSSPPSNKSSNASACRNSPHESPSRSIHTHVPSCVNDLLNFSRQDAPTSRIHTETTSDHGQSHDEIVARHDYSKPSYDTSASGPIFDDLQALTSPTATDHSSESDNSTRRCSSVSTSASDSEDFAITEIQSILDPFVRLPLEISTGEKSLIHFYLLVGRHSLLGTSSTPKCCPALDIARIIIPICPIYTLSHIIVAESLFSRLTQRPVRKHYYQRYGQMYHLLNTLLSDPEASIYRKLWSLIQVAMVEATVKRFDLQALHTTAMDDFLESQGDINTWRIKEDDGAFGYLASRLYALQLARNPGPIVDNHRFTGIKRRFMRNMKGICRWIASLDKHAAADGSTDLTKCYGSECELEWFALYFDQLELQQLLADTEAACRSRSEETLASSFSLLLTFVEWNFRPVTVRSFLASVQTNILGSIDTPSAGNDTRFPSVHPTVVAYNISYVRAYWFPDPDYRREMKISQAITDAKQILAILEPGTAMEIVTWLVKTVKIVSRINSSGVQDRPELSVFDDEQLLALERDIEHAWKRQRQSR